MACDCEYICANVLCLSIYVMVSIYVLANGCNKKTGFLMAVNGSGIDACEWLVNASSLNIYFVCE